MIAVKSVPKTELRSIAMDDVLTYEMRCFRLSSICKVSEQTSTPQFGTSAYKKPPRDFSLLIMANITLILSNNSLRNTTVSCDSLGIHYNVSKSGGIVAVRKWDAARNSEQVVGEFRPRFFSRDLMKFREDSDWRRVVDVLQGSWPSK